MSTFHISKINPKDPKYTPHIYYKVKMCTYGKKCMYKTSPNPQTGIPCSFAHSESELQIPICVYGSACKFNKSGTCSYKHVEGVEVSEETIVSISLKITTSSTSKLEKAHPIICKFGS